jgi:cysteine desulfurase
VRIYLDYNATSPLRPEAREAMREALEERFGNPSSVHWAGTEARGLVEKARAQVASLLGVEAGCLVFTSGATEANNAVLRAAALRAPRHGDHIVTCAAEHPSVLEVAEGLREFGLRVSVLPVDREGRLDPDRFARALDEGTLLASIMWANNETGVVQPIPELARLARERGVPFHTDAVQALGKVPLALGQLPVDFASFSAHKLGGPKGVGALYVRAGSRLAPFVRGGPQERRRRAGTENVPGVVGFGAACAAAGRDLETEGERLAGLCGRLWDGIEAKIPNVRLNGSEVHRLRHTLNVSFEGGDGEGLVQALDLEGIATSAGAACASGSTDPSLVLLAMGLSPQLARSSVRFSLGFGTDEGQIERVLEVLPDVVQRVRAEVRR